jgi:hypothetical protein
VAAVFVIGRGVLGWYVCAVRIEHFAPLLAPSIQNPRLECYLHGNTALSLARSTRCCFRDVGYQFSDRVDSEQHGYVKQRPIRDPAPGARLDSNAYLGSMMLPNYLAFCAVSRQTMSFAHSLPS